MANSRSRAKNLLSGLLIIVFVAAFGIGFGVVANRIANTLDAQVILAWATFVATTGFAIWSFNRTKKKEADALLFSERAKVYKEIIDVIRDLLFSTKGWVPAPDPTELAMRLSQSRFDLITWGGQDTIRAIMELENLRSDGPHSAFDVTMNLYSKIRRDLGHTDDDTLAEDLVLSQINLEEREQVRAQIRNYKSGSN
jgi:hypothetical protein